MSKCSAGARTELSATKAAYKEGNAGDDDWGKAGHSTAFYDVAFFVQRGILGL